VTPPGLRGRAQALWPALRAFLVTLALLVGLVEGLPFPTPELRAKLPSALLALLDPLQRAQLFALGPFRPIGDEFQLSQRWTLFVGAPTQRYRIRLEARERHAEDWTLLYRPHDPEHGFLASELEYRRVRGAWNPRRAGTPAGYSSAVSWIAGRVFDERPEFYEVRVRMEKIEILPRGAGFRSKGRFVNEQRRTRPEVGR
jgi:hypothetical protein